MSRLADEVTVLAQALAAPGKLVAEVEQMRALQVQADALQASDSAAAARLRRRASAMCRR